MTAVTLSGEYRRTPIAVFALWTANASSARMTRRREVPAGKEEGSLATGTR
jgi:hypothetical protein